MVYRHELKFEVSDADLTIIYYRLKALMHMDAHQEGSSYCIRSLYFDDFSDSCMQENEDGLDNRRKYRIRIYNGSDEIINLEKKIKCRGMTRKEIVPLKREICEAYMNGQIPDFSEAKSGLEKELFFEAKMNGMRPKSIVEYERTAFVEPKGNVRITFDRNISGCSQVNTFFDSHLNAVPVLLAGRHVLEVKYDELLPQYISDVLEISTLQQTSFSKYYYSRQGL